MKTQLRHKISNCLQLRSPNGTVLQFTRKLLYSKWFNLCQSWDISGLAEEINSKSHRRYFLWYFLQQLTLFWPSPGRSTGKLRPNAFKAAAKLCLAFATEAPELQDQE